MKKFTHLNLILTTPVMDDAQDTDIIDEFGNFFCDEGFAFDYRKSKDGPSHDRWGFMKKGDPLRLFAELIIKLKCFTINNEYYAFELVAYPSMKNFKVMGSPIRVWVSHGNVSIEDIPLEKSWITSDLLEPLLKEQTIIKWMLRKAA